MSKQGTQFAGVQCISQPRNYSAYHQHTPSSVHQSTINPKSRHAPTTSFTKWHWSAILCDNTGNSCACLKHKNHLINNNGHPNSPIPFSCIAFSPYCWCVPLYWSPHDWWAAHAIAWGDQERQTRLRTGWTAIWQHCGTSCHHSRREIPGWCCHVHLRLNWLQHLSVKQSMSILPQTERANHRKSI